MDASQTALIWIGSASLVLGGIFFLLTILIPARRRKMEKRRKCFRKTSGMWRQCKLNISILYAEKRLSNFKPEKMTSNRFASFKSFQSYSLEALQTGDQTEAIEMPFTQEFIDLHQDAIKATTPLQRFARDCLIEKCIDFNKEKELAAELMESAWSALVSFCPLLLREVRKAVPRNLRDSQSPIPSEPPFDKILSWPRVHWLPPRIRKFMAWAKKHVRENLGLQPRQKREPD